MVVVLKCDTNRDELADQTIPFTWRGQMYEVDYCDAHAAEADDYMQRLIGVARKAKRHKRKTAAVVNEAGQDRSAEGDDLTHRRAIRAWANANGHTVSSHGVIPRDVVEAYQAAHGKAVT